MFHNWNMISDKHLATGKGLPKGPTTFLNKMVPGAWIQVPGIGTRYLGPGTWYLVPGTWNQVPGTWYKVPGTRYVVPGTWYQSYVNFHGDLDCH